ncbi:beta-1,4-galactosyltransferase [Catenovulum sp. 2E275]|uniref:glycosyltransferase n=1 Tax=Catenovulum sp. 2E275 TaxID=2980497 RepID=UPI0021D1AF2F|nr:glycosyltransferase [Catenovulum sp. 2E275]MCU4674820.1 beta-1,4-galactosyltransferase [Catenovulum sp. 2E275]
MSAQKNTSKNKVLVVASAGGHLTQAMCATSCCDNLVLVSNKVNISHPKLSKIYQIKDTQHNALIHFFNIFFALYVLLKERPKAVFSTGGPIVLPFALLCKLLPIKFVYLDTLSRVVELSNTGKLIKKYKLYDQFFSQWENIAQQNNVQFIGKCFDILGENPVNNTKQQAPADKPVILVTVGTNQYGFERLFELLYQNPLYADDSVYWVLQVGHNKLIQLPPNAKVVEMMSRSEMEDWVKQASLVISHCGIGSINLMLSYQKKVIFVPRVAKYNEFSDDHQLQIANEIKSHLFDVIMPEQAFPALDVSDLKRQPILAEPVDTINYSMAKQMNQFLSA